MIIEEGCKMKIGELSKQSKTSVETLRYYEKQGLIAPPKRLANGYRNYSSSTISHLRFIQRAKKVGFSLRECKELLSIFISRDQHSCHDVKTLAENKLEEIQQQRLELEQMHHTLQKISNACCGGDESAVNCTILDALEKQP